MTQEKWHLWLETARPPLDSLSLVRMTKGNALHLLLAQYSIYLAHVEVRFKTTCAAEIDQ